MRRSALVLAGLLAVSIPAVSGAQPNVRRAEQLAGEALQLYRQADYDHAIEKFQQSYELVPDPNNLFNIGKCYERMNKFEEAIRNYRRYIVEAENAADRQEVEQRIANLERRPARVTISSNPPGATVYVDDTSAAPAGRTPLTVELPAGPHILTLRLQGYEQTARPIQGGYGREVSVDVALAAVAQGGGGQTVIVREDGTQQVVPAEEPKLLHLAGNIGVALGSVGTDVTLTPSVAFGIRLGYGIELASKLTLDLALSAGVEPRLAGDPVHTVPVLTFLLEPGLRLRLAQSVYLSAIVGIGAMNLIGLEQGDEFFADPNARPSGPLTFLDTHGGVSVWVHLTDEFAVAVSLGIDYSPAIAGITGDFFRFGANAGVVYRF